MHLTFDAIITITSCCSLSLIIESMPTLHFEVAWVYIEILKRLLQVVLPVEPLTRFLYEIKQPKLAILTARPHYTCCALSMIIESMPTLHFEVAWVYIEILKRLLQVVLPVEPLTRFLYEIKQPKLAILTARPHYTCCALSMIIESMPTLHFHKAWL